ncbi:MAG TPA: CDP-diacylglycerol--glycerol-3-phosphate 3-phosphatidyltransferase [Candidatus Dormibacteraeota bacterium]|nr:CDP-diacylglycerol--glycerol-3-phosphate 3-phosphatidyltransferase [Candidatus Dormibacteraeota bacterium]
MNLSNALTVSRLASIPVLMALLIVTFPYHDQIAAATFIGFSLTDSLDGILARRRGTVSDLGKFLDPLADKLFVLAVLIVLVQEGLVAAWVVVVIFSRELIITILRSVASSQGTVIAAAPLGKTKTITQMSAVTLLILQRPYPVLVPVADLAVAVAVVFTIVSGVDYLVRFRYVIGLGENSPGAHSPHRRIAGEVGELLQRHHKTVAVAESCTGGLLGSAFTEQAGSSAYFKGGVVAYTDQVKRDQLGVSADELTRHTAVSREVAIAMARGVQARLHADFAVSITCIAGPDSDASGLPVGLTYVGVATPRDIKVFESHLKGDREANRRAAARWALELLRGEVRANIASEVKTA